MKLRSIRIENFRSFRDETVHLDDYSCLVGPNGAGKSSVLMALNIFFRNSSASTADLLTLTQQDFHKGDTSKPIRVTLTFDSLNEDAVADFSAYVRQNLLVVSAVATWSRVTLSAPVLQFGSRLVHPGLAEYFEKDKANASAAELKTTYETLRAQFPALPEAKTKAAMAQALAEYESSNPDDCKLVESQDQFYGFTKGENLFARHLQFIYVPAVKDAVSEEDEEKTSALGQLLARTVRTRVTFKDRIDDFRRKAQDDYSALFPTDDGTLSELSESLQKRLRNWTTDDSRMTPPPAEPVVSGM